MRGAAGEVHESVFERCRTGASFESGQRVAGEQAPRVDDRDPIGELLDLRQRVGSEEQGSIAAAQDLGLQKAAKLRGGDSVQTARGFIQQKNARLVKKGAGEAQPLHRAGRKCAYLAVEGLFKAKLLGEMSDALRGVGIRKMVETAEKAEIFATGQSRIKADIAAGMIAKLAANGARIEDGIMPRDFGATVGWEQQRGENAEKSRFARAICAQQC